MPEREIKQRAVARWSRISERVGEARDRQEALRMLMTEFGFDNDEAAVVLAMRVGDLVPLTSPDASAHDSAKAEWDRRGREFTPNVWLPDERGPWRAWIVEGVDGGWLNVVRLREAGSLLALERTNNDRSVYISHEMTDGSLIRIHTAIGGTYGIDDHNVATELGERIDLGSHTVATTAMSEGRFGLCDVRLDGEVIVGRSLESQGWWAVAITIGPETIAFCTGPGTEIPALGLVTVKSFDELPRPVNA